MNHSLILVGLLLSQSAWATDWLSLLDPRASSSISYGVQFGGHEPFQHAGSRSMLPASISKVVTSVVALEQLGENYQFETRVEWEVDRAKPSRIRNLTIQGSGDPSWGLSELGESYHARMSELASHLHAQGVREILGPVKWTYTDSRWGEVTVPRGWKSGDLTHCYGALPGGFNLGLNCEVFTVTGARAGRWNDSRIQDPVTVNVKVGSKSAVWLSLGAQGYIVEGNLARGKSTTVAIPVRDVAGWLDRILSAQLAGAGIRESKDAPFTSRTSGSHVLRSQPLKQLIRPFMKQSLNLVGEALLMKLGELSESSRNTSLREAGVAVVQSYLARLSLQDQLVLWDGSGLSRDSRVMPSGYFAFLEHAKRLNGFPALYRSLPIAGVDGTLRNRMKGTRAANFFRGKTGTLNGVANVAGYFPLMSGSTVVDFASVVILGESSIGSAALRSGADRVLARLSQLHRPVNMPFDPLSDAPLLGIPNPFERVGFSYDPRSSEEDPSLNEAPFENPDSDAASDLR